MVLFVGFNYTQGPSGAACSCIWVKWSRLSLSRAWEMKGRHFRSNALWFVRGVKRAGVFSLSSFEGFSSEVALLVDPNPLGSCEWGWVRVWRGVNLSSHRFLLCCASFEPLATRVNAERRSDLLLRSSLQLLPRIGFSSLGWRGQNADLHCQKNSHSTCIWIYTGCDKKCCTFCSF